ncbi:MAG: 2-alkenal reductase [Parcubacteria group bacterium GW2011_GWA2_50_10]|nr:MAG: 2-alkenal reductase [Parcubacteria group bacterium GW2011_GWA2_50_10]
MTFSNSIRIIAVSLAFSVLIGGAAGGAVYWKLSQELDALRANLPASQRMEPEQGIYLPQTTEEERVINVVREASDAVVSIILTRDEPEFEQVFRDPFEEFFGEPSPFRVPELQQRGTERKEIGGGSGFLVSADGMIITNKHVVLADDVDYTVFTNDGRSFPAQILARDPVQDLAVLKIEGTSSFPFLRLGNSERLQIGQTVIAIGNALAEFRNTVSVGVISGLGRTITASDGQGFVETIEDVIQTDAAINKGNSGGPLLNLAGEVVGMNTATVLDAQNIGFAIPSDRAKRGLYQVRELGKIVYPFLGIQYALVTERLQEEENLPVDYGALIQEVVAGSAGAQAGLQKNDILLEFDGKKITQQNSLAKIIQRYDETKAKPTYSPGDTVSLKVLRNGKERALTVILGERKD